MKKLFFFLIELDLIYQNSYLHQSKAKKFEMKSRGLLIVFEGLDKSGKSTQSKLLYEALSLKNLRSELWRFPNRNTTIGKLIDSYLKKECELQDNAVHLLFSANRWELVDEMKEKLNSGINLIVDRYAYSGVAYSSAKTGLDFDWCKQCDVGLPKADLVCFMDTRSTSIEGRECFGQERYENVQFQSIVYNNFKKLFQLDKTDENDDCLVLNARDKIETIHSRILDHVLDLQEKNLSSHRDISYLWD
jgi:dTMP kinase